MRRTIKLSPKTGKVRIVYASQRDREVIYQLRHEVYVLIGDGPDFFGQPIVLTRFLLRSTLNLEIE